MKHIVMIDQHTHLNGKPCYTFNESKNNKSYIIEYNTSLDGIICYAMGFLTDKKEYDPMIYFSNRINLSNTHHDIYNNQIINESDFQKRLTNG